jgi:hypothetical protein
MDDLEAFADSRPAFRRRNLRSEPHVLCLTCQYIVSGSELLLDLGGNARRGYRQSNGSDANFKQAKKAFTRVNGSIGLGLDESRHHFHLQHASRERKIEFENPPMDAIGEPVLDFGTQT